MGCKQSKKQDNLEAAALLRAAILIQRWHRRHLARLEMRRRCTWHIFQSLEYASEQDQAQLYKFFNDLLTLYPDASGEGDDLNKPTGSKTTEEIGLGEPDEKYRGPHLRFPLARKDIDILIDLFRKSNVFLHAKYVAALLEEAKAKLQELPNINLASTAVSKQMTVVGDLHGKLEDLLVIFHKNGLPSTDNPYVFNGDFVDRGKKGLEVLLLVLACFLAFPGSVFPNRGNHEDTVMNVRYGFLREMQNKYGDFSDRLFKYIEDVYRWLPLGTLINNKVLVVHGGISDTSNLDLLKRLNRSKYVSILRPPIDLKSESVDKTEWQQLFDVMWSDPQIDEGCRPNTTRGAGTFWGPDVTEKFLARYRLAYIIRSHECKPDGYEFTHNDHCITIFSASNYYAAGSNRGAYMKLNPHLDPHFVQYVSAVSKTANLTFEQKVGVVESSALRELGARLRAQADFIEKEFKKWDPNGTGQIPVNKWATALEQATNLELPWHLLVSKLAPGPAKENHADYKSTLELLRTNVIIETQENETTVAESLYKNRSALEAIFHILDKDNSGTISIDEFAEVCDLLERRLGGEPSKEKLMELCKLMDINGDGQVDLNEFLEAFRLSCQKNDDSSYRSPETNFSSPVQAQARKLAGNSLQTDDNESIDPTDYEVQPAKPEVEQVITSLRNNPPDEKKS